jgi:hypothetical protein
MKYVIVMGLVAMSYIINFIQILSCNHKLTRGFTYKKGARFFDSKERELDISS